MQANSEKDKKLSEQIKLAPKNFEVFLIVCSEKHSQTLKEFAEKRIGEMNPRKGSFVVIASGDTVESAMKGKFDFSVVSWILLCPETEAHGIVSMSQLSKHYGERVMNQLKAANEKMVKNLEIAVVDVRCQCEKLCECGLRPAKN